MEELNNLIKKWNEDRLALPIWLEGKSLRIVNQISLPRKEEVLVIDTVEQLVEAIKDMTIRGSGAIGIAGAYGILLEGLNSNGDMEKIYNAATLLKSSRPTAVNLMKTVDEIIDYLKTLPKCEILEGIFFKVTEILKQQLEYEYRLGEYGAELIEDGDNILTHCHSGALAGSGYGGRALSVIRTAWDQGKNIHVYVSETRPYLQGARITAYELEKFGIPHTLITDGMSGYLMKLGKVQKVVVGSDRVAQNGDLLNKVGTYMHALAAKDNNIPFYTATSSHTIDFKLEQGLDINVEYRDGKEVTHIAGKQIAPDNTKAIYPSFDVTPNNLIKGIITEKGVIFPSYSENLKIINNK